MSPALIGKNVLDMKDKAEDPAKGKLLFKEFTEMAKTKGEGWVEYMWANPGDRSLGRRSPIFTVCRAKNIYAGAGIWE